MTPTVRLPVARPLAGALGAEVEDVDLSSPVDDDTVSELRGLLDRHLVLFFRGQEIGDEDQLALASRFGTPYIHPIARTLGRTRQGVERIVDSVEHPPYQDRWHTDVSWDPAPPVYGFLRAAELPSRGGDTIWASMYAAYDALVSGHAAHRRTARRRARHGFHAGVHREGRRRSSGAHP